MVNSTTPGAPGDPPLRGPVRKAWQERILTRAMEIETLSRWAQAENPGLKAEVFAASIRAHLEAACQAAEQAGPASQRRLWDLFRPRGPAQHDRAMSNLDAAESELLNIAPAEYLLGQMASLLEHVRSHLGATDPQRQEFERIAQRLGVNDKERQRSAANLNQAGLEDLRTLVDGERGAIASITRAANSAAMREQIRVRGFRSVVVGTTCVMLAFAILAAVVGYLWPSLIPLCSVPESDGKVVRVVCPTGESPALAVDAPAAELSDDINVSIDAAVSPMDIAVVELVGLIAAAVAAAGTLTKLRGSSESYSVLVALAALKLPTGAITAFLGILLLQQQFIPGLSALDTSAQILVWALVFGYAQQLFTRSVDQLGQTILNSVQRADAP